MLKHREFFTHRLILFVMGLSLVSVATAVATFDGYRSLLGVLLGVLVYAVAEYVVHRYLLHEYPRLFPKLYQGHKAHHDHPREIAHLFGPVQYDILVYIGYTLLLWLIFREVSVVSAVVAGTITYQLYYQWMHYVSHRPIVPITPWGKWMKKKHLLHHYKDERIWYGVSHPAMDYLMGTHQERKEGSR